MDYGKKVVVIRDDHQFAPAVLFAGCGCQSQHAPSMKRLQHGERVAQSRQLYSAAEDSSTCRLLSLVPGACLAQWHTVTVIVRAEELVTH